MEYVKKANEKGCFLCKAFKEKKDRKNLIIARGKYSFVIMNRYPYNTGHLMITPIRHTGKLESLTKEEVLEMFEFVIKMKARITKTLKPEGFNIGINLGRVAGAGLVSHVHIHLVPRWSGDTNFMPALCKTKVISQSLDKLYSPLAKKK
jgi:ATP adenylyltransferase